MALSIKPKLLLLDEPTTSLDSKNRDIIVELIRDLSKKDNFLYLFVTHDIDIAFELCQNMLVIFKGKAVEFGKSNEILSNPKEEYTKRLINANFKYRSFRK